jgi:hypothetical protein
MPCYNVALDLLAFLTYWKLPAEQIGQPSYNEFMKIPVNIAILLSAYLNTKIAESDEQSVDPSPCVF